MGTVVKFKDMNNRQNDLMKRNSMLEKFNNPEFAKEESKRLTRIHKGEIQRIKVTKKISDCKHLLFNHIDNSIGNKKPLDKSETDNIMALILYVQNELASLTKKQESVEYFLVRDLIDQEEINYLRGVDAEIKKIDDLTSKGLVPKYKYETEIYTAKVIHDHYSEIREIREMRRDKLITWATMESKIKVFIDTRMFLYK